MTDLKDPTDRVTQLQGFLQADPENVALRMDLAETALQANCPEIALEALQQWPIDQESGNAAMTLKGLCLLKLKSYAEAVDCFEQALTVEPENTALRFNLAWSQAMLGQKATALNLLDEATTSALPQAAMLHIQLLHEAGDLEGGWQRSEGYLEQHPNDPGLNAAISVLALDLEKTDVAMSCAERSNGHPDALATLGTLALDADNIAEAEKLFTHAVQVNQTRPRAWIGLGLSDLINGQYTDATKRIDYGASLFETHIGSWIAAGWAYLLSGDHATARARFEKALSLDRNFSESHGSLAVIEAMEGNTRAAKDLSKRAFKLDKSCFSAAFASSLILSSQGQEKKAQRIFDQAINSSIGDNGKTVAQSLSRLGLT
ncbi:MAG: tetratricopeptide repeat protein [Pseudomonadota bacterium]